MIGFRTVWTLCAAALMSTPCLEARQWTFKGVADPVEAEFVGESNGYVVFKGHNGMSFELPLANLSPADQQFIRALGGKGGGGAFDGFGRAVTRSENRKSRSLESINGAMITLNEAMDLRVTGSGDL